MADVSILHGFESAIADDPDPDLIQPSHWNAEHALGGGSLGGLLYRDTGSATGGSWLDDVAVGSVLVSGGVGAAPAWSATIGPAAAGITFFNGRVGIGTATPLKGILHVDDGGGSIAAALLPGGTVQLLTGSASGTLVGITATSATAHQPGLYLRSIRARGTLAVPTAVGADDLVGLWGAEGYNGSARIPTSEISQFIEAASGSNLSGYISFLTAALGGSNVERLRIGTTMVTLASGVGLTLSGGALTLSSPLGAAFGGTGLASYTVGDLLSASGATALSKLAGVATGQVLVSGGVAMAPGWSASPTLTSVALTTSLSLGGNLAASATPPTFTSGFGGATGRSLTGTAFGFTIVCGNNGSDTSGVLAMPTASNGWAISATNQTAIDRGDGGTLSQSAGTTSSVTLRNLDTNGGDRAFGSGDVLKCVAVAY
jgi:hypothetical protein